MNCAQIKERLVDFLYDELPAEARASFAEHLGTCPACKAEVASYQHTLGSARVALGGPLLEEPPARVHLAVVEAAKAAAKQATRTKAKAPTPRDELGFFARLWRTPWFLPAFGAASVATVVFLVRVLKNPEVLPGQRPHPIEERSVATPAPPPPPEPTPGAKAAAAPAAAAEGNAEVALDAAKGSGSAGRARKLGAKAEVARVQAASAAGKRKSDGSMGLGGLKLQESQSRAGATQRFAEPPPPRAATKSSKDIDDLLGDFKQVRTQPQPFASPSGGKVDRVRDDEDRLEGASEKAAVPARKAPQPAAEMAKPTTRSPTHSAGSPAAASAGAAAPAYAPVAPAPTPAPQPMRDYPAESTANAPAPPASSAAMRKKSWHEDEEAKASAEATHEALAKDKKAKSPAEPAPSLDESVRKAERLYASQDWNAAATAYRDLLNRFPGHKDAPRWRDRMNESNAAHQRALEAKRKKTRSDDPLSGSKL